MENIAIVLIRMPTPLGTQHLLSISKHHTFESQSAEPPMRGWLLSVSEKMCFVTISNHQIELGTKPKRTALK